MDSAFHSTVMRRPEDEGEEVARRERDRINGASSSSNTYDVAPQTKLHHSPYSPTNGTHPRPPQFTNTYHPSTPAPLSMPTPTASHPPASPRSLTASSAYQSELLPAPREKPKSNYYDPTSDSGPSESAGWREGQNQNQSPKVNRYMLAAATGRSIIQLPANVIFFPDSRKRTLHLSIIFRRPLQRSIYFTSCHNSATSITYLACTSHLNIAKDGHDDFADYATQRNVDGGSNKARTIGRSYGT